MAPRQLSDIRPGEGTVGGEGVSLVHRGANRRRFLLAKADSDTVDETVAYILSEPAAGEDRLLDAVRKTGGDESVEKAAATAARAIAALNDSYSEADPALAAAVRKAMGDLMNDGDGPDDENDDDGDAEDEDGNGDAVAKDYEAVIKRTFTADERKKLADSGAAMKDGSYPIPNREYLERAVHAIGRGNAPHASIRAHIIRRAKDLGATDALPDDWNVTKEDTTMTDAATVPVPIKKEDGSYDLSGLPAEARPVWEEIFAKAAENEKRAEEAEKIAKAEQLNRERREFVAKSAGYENLAKSDDEFGDVLREIAKAEENGHLSEGVSEKLDAVLKAANEAAASVFKEAGRTGHTDSNANDGVAKIEAIAKALRDADPTLTKEQAFVKALDTNKSLYDETKGA